MTNYEKNKIREDAKHLLAMDFLILTDIADAIKRNDYDAMSKYSEDLSFMEAANSVTDDEEFKKDYQKVVERLAYFDDDSKERLVNELPDYLEK